MLRFIGRKRLLAVSILLGLAVLSVSACQREVIKTVEETPSDHPHRLPDTKVVGDYHVSFLVDHRRGEIEVYITDAQERPFRLEEPFIKGIIVDPAGVTRHVRLKPARYERRRLFIGRAALRPEDHSNPSIHVSYVPHSAIFSYQADWVTQQHDFTIQVEVPINHILHKASFDFSTSPEENQHHSH